MTTESGRKNKNEKIRVEYTCTPRAKFFDTSPKTRWYADFFGRFVSDKYQEINHPMPQPNHNKDFFHALTGIEGEMRGYAERASITQTTPSAGSTIQKKSVRGTLRAYTTGFGMLAPANGTHRYGDGRTYTVDTKGDLDKTMMPKNSAFCYLIHIGGDSERRSDLVRIREGDIHWILEARSYLGVGNYARVRKLHAQANCVSYNQQRTSPTP